jgi:hypothetical protein
LVRPTSERPPRANRGRGVYTHSAIVIHPTGSTAHGFFFAFTNSPAFCGRELPLLTPAQRPDDGAAATLS